MRDRMPALPERVSALEVRMSAAERRLDEGTRILGRMEKAVQRFTDAQADDREAEEKQYRRVANRMRWLTVVIAIAAVCVPVVSAILHLKG